MRSQCWWYCKNGHCWLHDSQSDNARLDDPHRPRECPECHELWPSGPFASQYQAEFIYLKRLDDKRLGE